ncbi:MAG: ACT domain-containing protein [Chloroflexota bacterium]|nr:ACT domain-containing protein [Chloroflexota bacterium]
MPLDARDAIQKMQLFTDEERYRYVSLPLNRLTAAAGVLAEIREPFAVLIMDKDELSLVLTEGDVEDFRKRLGDARISDSVYRLITFDIALGEGVIGFMAIVSAALAAASVTIMPFAAFQRDHLLVTVEHFDTAWKTLEKLRTAP